MSDSEILKHMDMMIKKLDGLACFFFEFVSNMSIADVLSELDDVEENYYQDPLESLDLYEIIDEDENELATFTLPDVTEEPKHWIM